MQLRVDEVDETLSAKMIEDTLAQGGTWNFGSYMAQQHAAAYEQHELSAETQAYFAAAAQESLARLQTLEQDDSVSFDQYLTQFR